MKIICANPECAKTVRTLSVKLGLPGAGEKRDNQWFCSDRCYRSYLADQYIEDKRCGLKKTIRQVKLGMILVKNHFITPKQLAWALEEENRSLKRLGEILVDAGHITEKELKAVLSMQAGVAPVILEPQTKIKLKDEIPFKIINEFHMVIFDFDLESKVILIAVYEMDYIVCLQEYFSKIFPGYLIKFYLEEKEKILTILDNNYPGKPLRVDAARISPGKEEGIEDTRLNKEVMKLVEFLNAFSGNDVNDVKIDNLDNAVWLKSETKDFKIDIYLTRKTRGKV
jgi:type IV pilus assembly protein PilB